MAGRHCEGDPAMIGKWALGATTLLLVSLATASPSAADLCFQYGSGGGIAVARGATVPAPNKCQNLALYEVGAAGLEGAATGSICQDWAGATLVFHYTYDACLGNPGGYFESATCRIELKDGRLPSTASSCRGKVNNGTFTDDTLKVWSCDADADINLRVPNDIALLCLKSRGRSHKLDSNETREKDDSQLNRSE